MLNDVEDVLVQFDKIDLIGLEAVKLLNRIDFKHILHTSDLNELLAHLKEDYSLLEINKLHLFDYETQYYDSPEFQLYYAHHNGRPNRFKIRRRRYVYNNQNFFEIKHKIKGNRTHKFRVEKSGEGNSFSEIEQEMLNLTGAPNIALQEKLKVNYSRITLAAKSANERITIDLGLSYSNNKEQKNLNDLVIVEVKQGVTNRRSKIILYLKSKKKHPLSMSKYAIGIAMLESSVKKNAFKSKIIQINKILNNA